MKRSDRHSRVRLPIFAAIAAIVLFFDCFAGGHHSIEVDAATTRASASTGPVPRIIRLPDGFVRVTAGQRIAMCEPADQPWVRDCLAQSPPATQPSTRPADLLARLQSQKDTLERQLTGQLNLADKQVSHNFVADTLLPRAQKLARLKVKVIYLVITKENLKRLVISGWGSDQFHYNRIADKIAFDGMVDISLDAGDGESVVPAPYVPADPVDVRSANLREEIGRTEGGVADMIARQAQSSLQLSIARFIADQAIAPLKLRLGGDWFSAGVIGYLSSDFLAMINGARPQDIIQMIARSDPDNPVAASSIDLLNPIPPDQLRPEIAGAYGDAFRHRSIQVIASWVERAGPDAIRNTLAAIRSAPPVDGPALVNLIRKTTGIDLSNELAPQ
jgi:hypothetical protein